MTSRRVMRANRRGTRVLALALLFALVTTLTPQDATAYLSTGPASDKSWYWQNPTPQGNQLNAVSFIDSQRGWAVGNAGTVIRTDTGGQLWEALDADVAGGILRAVAFVDENTGWLAGDSGRIRATVDGGDTWTTQAAGTTQALRAMDFVNAQTGWVVGSSGVIRATTNGGANWLTVTSGTTSALYGVDFHDTSNGWAVGASGTILRSTDGGASWAAQTSGVTALLWAVEAIDAQTAWAVGASGTVLRTTDGGATWTPVSLGVTTTLYEVEFADADTGWITGATGFVRATTDGGATWTNQNSGTLNLLALAASTTDDAVAVGAVGAIVRTTDGGLTWLSEAAGTTRALYGLDFADPVNGLAVGAAGTVLKTTDAGASWNTLSAGSALLRAVDLVDASIGYTVGDGGVILKTTNGGGGWTPQVSGVTSILRGVRFVDASVGWAVGNDGVILKTTDGGTTWGPQTSGVTTILYSIDALDDQRAWAVGASGRILKTTDGGSTWAIVPSGITQALYDIQVFSDQDFVVVGTGGRVRRTTDGGSTWTAQTTGTTQSLWSVAFSDAQTGWVVGAAGTVLRTINGGATWSAQNAATTATLYGVGAHNHQNGWLVGASGVVRRTTNSGSTWTSLTYGTVSAMHSLAFADADTGWAVGASGLVRRTRDGGLTWRNLTSGTTATLYGVDFLDATTGWIAGTSGVIRKTGDAGDTWTAQTSGVTSALYDIDFADEDRGWAVGAAGTILATTNGGSTWTTQTAGTAAVLRAVHFLDATTGWVVGDGGTILTTIDGGSTWTPQSSGVTSILYGVTFADSQTGWAVGAGGAIRATNDGGATWTGQTSGTTQVLYGVHNRGISRAWVVGAAGTIRRTSDGGATWTGQASGTANVLRAIAFVDEDHGWLVGNTGTTLRTTSATPPETVATLDPAAPDGEAEWFSTAPSITLQRNKPGLTRYSWVSSTGPWTTYVDPVTALEGERTFYYYSIDSANNIEAVKSFSLKTDSVAPSAPTTVTASVAGTSTIELDWTAATDDTSGVSHYAVYVGGSFEATTAALAYSVTGLVPDTEYSFTILASDVAGNASDPSTPVAARTDPIDTSPVTTTAVTDPPAPDGENGWFTTVPSIELTWTSPPPPPLAVTTYYSWDSTSGPWAVYSAPLSPAEGETTLYFSSHDDEGVRDPETTRTVTFKVDTAPPPAPTITNAMPYGIDGAYVEWPPGVMDPTSGIARYDLYLYSVRQSGETTVAQFEQVVNVPGTQTSGIIQGIEPYVEHFVHVIAVDGAGNESQPSNAIHGMTLQSMTPEPPTRVVAKAMRGSEVFVAWDTSPAETFGAITYHVWRSSGGEWTFLGTSPGKSNHSYVDVTAGSSTPYWYAVAVQDDRGVGTLSDTSTVGAPLQAVVTPVPVAPRGLRSVVASDGAVALAWTPAAQPNLAGYHVLRGMSSGGLAQTLTVDPVGTGSYVDTTTAPFRRYWYSVVSVDTSGAVGARSIETYARSRTATGAPSPHTSFSSLAGNRCGLCHKTHEAPSERKLLTVAGDTERALCVTCHDGTSGPAVAADLQLDENGTSHGLGKNGAAGELTCSDCHTTHASAEATQTLRLLDVDGATQGNAVCYGCHGEASELPGGDLRVFEGSGHNSGVDTSTVSAGIVCLTCHETHGSPNAYLARYDNINGCLNCHSAETANPDSPDILSLLTYSPSSETRHDILPSDQAANDSFITCQNCHNTHAATDEYPLVDPYDPSPSGVWTSGEVNDFCFRCHDGSLPTAADTGTWVRPPLGRAGSTVTADIQTAWGYNRHGFATGSSTTLRPEMGYAPGDVLQCSACHEPHGAANHHNLRGDVRSVDGVFIRKGLIVFDVPEGEGGGHDTRYFCSACHDLDAEWHEPASGVDLSVFPIDCTGCHNHIGGGL